MTSPSDLLPRVLRDLHLSAQPFALVGGLAVAARSGPRFTNDVDFAVVTRDNDAAESFIRYFTRQKGYDLKGTIEDAVKDVLRGSRLIPPGQPDEQIIVDVLFRTCGIEDEVVAFASNVEILPGLTIPVAQTGHLIAMKILSQGNVAREQDTVDLAALTRAASVEDLQYARKGILLMQERGYRHALGKDLLHDLAQSVQLYSPHLAQAFASLGGPPEDKLAPEVFTALGALGWKLPTTEHEVEVAELGQEEDESPLPARYRSKRDGPDQGSTKSRAGDGESHLKQKKSRKQRHEF